MSLKRSRARDLGVRFGELPTGPRNMITDVPDVKVGHLTLREGSGKLEVGRGPVRTGVTVVLPHSGNLFERPVKGAYFALNGCGGLFGALQLQEFGLIDTPIGLTNTMSMGTLADGIIRHILKLVPNAGIELDTIIPIVSECDDSHLNDARGLHVKSEHASAAIGAASDVVQEGAVGAGTGMMCYDFKGGIGTSSRLVKTVAGDYTLGTLVLSNHGERKELVVDGVPVGKMLKTPNPRREEKGSIVMIVGTDAPVDARQLGRIAKRAGMGLATTGSCAHNGSGDIVIAFSTANSHDKFKYADGCVTDKLMVDRELDPLFRATVDSTAESVINSLFMAETTEGRDGNVAPELPIEETLALLRSHGRLD